MEKKFLLPIALLVGSLTLQAQIYVEPEKNVECTVFLEKQGRGMAQQGMEIWDRYIFSCEDGGHVNVYDFRTASPKPIAGFELGSSRPNNHVNNVCFGVETAKGGSFPLLYVTNGKVGSEIEWTCFVENIRRRGRKFSSEIVQTIVLDGKGWDAAGFVPIFGAPSWLVDRERGQLWIFSARKRTVPSVTRNAWENQYVATRFRIPTLSEGQEVHLGAGDILGQAVFPFDVWFTQAGCVHDGKIYFCFGLGRKDKTRPSRIRVYDTDRRTICARYELQEQVLQEPEDIVVRDGWMYLNANTNPSKTKENPCIYRISLPSPRPKSESDGQISQEPEGIKQISQDPERAGGVYYITDLSNPVTAAPEGYEPFYINGYFRHGARHIDDKKTYPFIYGLLEENADNLSGLGKAVRDRLMPFRRNLEYCEGDLTGIGYRQGEGIGRRMVENYPEVFREGAFIKMNSTNVLRVSATMQAVHAGMLSLQPSLGSDEISNSRSFLEELNPYGSECPGVPEIDRFILHGKEASWRKEYESYLQKHIDTDAFLARLFQNPDAVKAVHDPIEVEWRFFLMASLMQCLDRQVPLWDLFTPEEIYCWAVAENYKYFSQKGPEPKNRGRSWARGAKTLRHLLEESRRDILAGRHGVDLNFGHDGVLMAVLTNLQAGSWAEEARSPEEAFTKWQYWNIPMGANLQMIFYHSVANPDKILVKFMLNEKDLKLPLESVQGPYYDWVEVYDFYIRQCDKAERLLADTENLSYDLF